mmetsp:Transcript_5445/g.7572  ORF Transcript_5445/g.7572 Transcript_5445/m.7572 type:complete len:455 (-) Transcript_5445:40-1404(-)
MSGEEKKRSNGAVKLDQKEIEHKNFDLKKYISNYAGHTKVKRLVYIGCKCPSVRLAAFRMAIAELKTGRDIETYTQTVSQARELLGNSLGEKWGYDKAWVEAKRCEYYEKENLLDSRVSMHKREEDSPQEIQAALRELISFLQSSGNFRDAQTKIRECQDYCRTTEDKMHCRLAEIENSIQQDLTDSRVTMPVKLPTKWGLNLTQKYGTKRTVQAKIHAANALHHLHHGMFENAAHVFKLISFDINSPTIISKIDVAIYGTLCAMASFKRAQLQTNLLKSGEFKKFMSLVPGLVEMVQNFVQCKFKKAFAHLENMKPDILLDYYMARHQETIYQKIHELAVIQYFVPFSHAKISRMAEEFGVSQIDMENRLVKLIERGSVQARIDNVNKVVIARDTDVRCQTYKKVLEIGDAHIRDLKGLLMRMSLNSNDYVITMSQRSQLGVDTKKVDDVSVM